MHDRESVVCGAVGERIDVTDPSRDDTLLAAIAGRQQKDHARMAGRFEFVERFEQELRCGVLEFFVTAPCSPRSDIRAGSFIGVAPPAFGPVCGYAQIVENISE